MNREYILELETKNKELEKTISDLTAKNKQLLQEIKEKEKIIY